jgi:hypothetical protein
VLLQLILHLALQQIFKVALKLQAEVAIICASVHYVTRRVITCYLFQVDHGGLTMVG